MPPEAALRVKHHEPGSFGDIIGKTRQGWDVQLTAYAARDWRANFFPIRVAHSIVGGSAWEPTPWRAVQRAAWDPLEHAEQNL